MSFLEGYVKTIRFEETKKAVINVTTDIFSKQLGNFDYRSNKNGLLLGEVQSGKTGQIFGVIAAAADRDFQIFILLTTDNKRLQEQTFKRALESFPNFCICGENDSIRFKMNRMRNPVIIILKKNTSILKKWRNELINSGYLKERPLFIIDDEADAASLNTKVNKNDISTINLNITELKKTAVSCIYLQVTATPQAVLLQNKESNFKPDFVTYFKPSNGYIGGDFFFSEPESYCIRYVDTEEGENIKTPDVEISSGLAQAILNFLVVCADLKITSSKEVCNFLIHPSVKIKDHEVIAEKIGEFLNDFLQNIEDSEIQKNLHIEWDDLYKTKPEIKRFSEVYDYIKEILFNTEIRISTLNSKSDSDQSFETGYNIIVGGNTLGRGVTFPNLQTIYYSRTAKVPQADTFWQHCRMFGYDRDRGTIRLFMSPFIHKLFQELNNSQTSLVKQITKYGIDNTHLIYMDGIKPTRSNVVNNVQLSLITGGVNYFAAYPENKDIGLLDYELLPKLKESYIDTELVFFIKILSNISSQKKEDWNSDRYINAIRILSESEKIKTGKMLIRVNRDLSKNTGTMLSANDRELVKKYSEDLILVLYRVNGKTSEGWNGKPFWMPNIKFPEGFTFYKID